MIFDNIKNINQYSLSDNILCALKQASAFYGDNYTTDKIELENGDFILPNIYQTQLRENMIFEAHKKYIDVMYMVEGEEKIFLKSTDKLTNITSEYNSEKDCLLAEEFSGISSIVLQPGDFIILYPQDAHCPACASSGTPSTVKKVICKIRVQK